MKSIQILNQAPYRRLCKFHGGTSGYSEDDIEGIWERYYCHPKDCQLCNEIEEAKWDERNFGKSKLRDMASNQVGAK